MKATLIAITQPMSGRADFSPTTAEELIVYAARVSNPSNQDNMNTSERLLNYCIVHKHWSVFETASMTIEIETSLAIATQLLRHRSFTFQMFSQRYAEVGELNEMFETTRLRIKASGGNRQGSVEGILPISASSAYLRAIAIAHDAYDLLIGLGIAPESARFVLPQCTKTRLYMTGNVRSWIHYLEQRCSSHAQKEHQDVAHEISGIFSQQFPIIHKLINQI